MRTKGSKNGAALDAKFREAGYVRRSVAAEKLGVAEQTVSLWVTNLAVRSQLASGVRYVFWSDCVKKFGVDAAVIVGAISKEYAAKLKKRTQETEGIEKKGASNG